MVKQNNNSVNDNIVPLISNKYFFRDSLIIYGVIVLLFFFISFLGLIIIPIFLYSYWCGRIKKYDNSIKKKNGGEFQTMSLGHELVQKLYEASDEKEFDEAVYIFNSCLPVLRYHIKISSKIKSDYSKYMAEGLKDD